MTEFPQTWLDFCDPQLAAEVRKAEARVADIAAHTTIYPAPQDRYRALRLKPADCRVVILGQDPYHGEDLCHGVMLPQAMGLSFSVPDGMRFPPSLRNIAKELHTDVGVTLTSGDLSPWAEQGVLLLNTGLTVSKGEAASHKGFGWHAVTDRIIAALGRSVEPRVFILWGAHAQAKQPLIATQHGVIASVHPSPLSASRGFFGSKPFSRANGFLSDFGLPPIVW